MSVLAVARKEFSDTRRSRTLWGVVGLFVLAVGGVTYIYAEFFTAASPAQQVETTAELTAGAVSVLAGLAGGFGPVDLVVPLIGLLLGYKAIVGERETGRIKLLLGLPHSRQDVVFGKLLGRTAVAALAVVAGFLAAGVVLLVVEGGVTAGPLLALLAVTLLLAAVYVSVGIGVSALAPSGGWATVMVVGVVAVFQVLWGVFFFAIRFIVLDAPTNPPTWFQALQRASPTNAYRRALVAVLEAVTDLPVEDVASPADAPVPLQDWFGFVWLAAWGTVPLLVGLLAFREADLT